MSIVKSLVYNGRFSVGGSIRQFLKMKMRPCLLKKKVSPVASESKSLLLKNCPSRSCHLGVKLCVLRFPCMDEFLELPTSPQQWLVVSDAEGY